MGQVQEYVYKFRNLMEQISNMDEMDKVMHFVNGLKLATQVKVNYNMPWTLEMAIEIAIRYDTARFGPTQALTYNYAHLTYGIQVQYNRGPAYHPQNHPFRTNNMRPRDDLGP